MPVTHSWVLQFLFDHFERLQSTLAVGSVDEARAGQRHPASNDRRVFERLFGHDRASLGEESAWNHANRSLTHSDRIPNLEELTR